MEIAEVHRFRDRVDRELRGRILPFWMREVVDHEHGGFLARLSNDLRPDPSGPKGLILNARILWTFSAVHQVWPETAYQDLARRAREYLDDRFWDAEHGGAFWFLDREGRVIDATKKVYGQAFLIYALAEFARAFGDRAALGRAIATFERIEQHAREPRFGGYIEAFQRDWTEAADLRLSAKDPNERKSMNTHLHLLEAYTSLFRSWPDPRLRARLIELIELFERRITDPITHHFHHFFDDAWQVRSDSYTYGHDIEGSWLLVEAADALGERALSDRVRRLAVDIAGAVRSEGLGADGGLAYAGRRGAVTDAGREFWPQAEAVVGFLNAGQLSGDAGYYDAAHRAWAYAEAHLADQVHGEWFWRVNPDGRPDLALWKVSEWKCPYHTTRACLETLRRLDSLAPVDPSPERCGSAAGPSPAHD
ncbi:MAG TPA: AGE family epimerase/isomerase [Verrucomicrobiota bacterium]|nr:AGE family epimerase/isomerase [Verrucomicrobiota bacterium]HNU50558.1 AGE family epimerase/isomerase [Verrucomicrobiota bacterium]